MGQSISLTISTTPPDYPHSIAFSGSPGYDIVLELINPEYCREREVDIDLIKNAIDSISEKDLDEEAQSEALMTLNIIREAAEKYGGFITINVG